MFNSGAPTHKSTPSPRHPTKSRKELLDGKGMVIDHAAISAASRASLNIDELSSFVVSVCIVRRWGSDGVISPEASGLLSPMGSELPGV